MSKLRFTICGETGRTIRSRILEHINIDSSIVKQHIDSHKPLKATIKWKILQFCNITKKRQCIENIHINYIGYENLINVKIPQTTNE